MLFVLSGVQRVEQRRAKLRERSKKVFGNADRIEVAAAIARSSSGFVNGQELHEELGISPPRVRTQLLALCDGGLLRTIPRAGLKQYYERVDDDDPFWTLVEQVAAKWAV